MKRLRSGMVFLLASTLLAALGMVGSAALADSFDWRTVAGQDFVTPVKDQGGAGTCWAFSAVGDLEAKYKLTRNDPSFNIDLSEQNLVCAGVGTILGGWPSDCMNYFTSTGVVTEAELPYTQQSTSPDWPLTSGWQNRVAMCTSWSSVPADVSTIKADLKIDGPLSACIYSGDLNSETLGTSSLDHAILIVGYVDNSSWAGGGYFIIKNSWGATWNGNGFGDVAYSNITRQGVIDAITGAAYYTGTMYFSGTDETNPANYHTGAAAIATWTGTGTGSSNSTWSTSATHDWSIGGTAFTWVNQEVGAVFDSTSPSSKRSITISGTAIAHGLTFSTAGTGYSFSGGALTVTAGGITASESVTFNSPITVGAPQSWTVAAGKTLTVGAIHTVISDVTFNGAGSATITGAVDGGGVANAEGAPAGRLVQDGPGTVTFTAAASCADNIIFYGGTLSIAMTGDNFTGGTTVGGGLLQVGASSTVSGGTLAYSPLGEGALVLSGGTLQDDGGGRTLATAATINGNITLASAGAVGVTFAPLGLATPNVVTLSNSPTINVIAPTTIADQIVGSGFTKSGPGVLAFTASVNSYTGPTTVSGGTLQGTIANIATPVVLANGAAVTFNQPSSGTLTNAVSGAGSLVKTGSGTLDLDVNSSYSGATNICGGVLRLDPAQIPIAPAIWYDPSNSSAVVTSGGSATQLTNLGSLGPVANATVVSGHLAPALNAANTAFGGRTGTGMPTLSFGYIGGDTLEGPSTNTATAGTATLMTFNNQACLSNTGYTILAVAARSFNNGALRPGAGTQPPALIFSWRAAHDLEWRPRHGLVADGRRCYRGVQLRPVWE